MGVWLGSVDILLIEVFCCGFVDYMCIVATKQASVSTGSGNDGGEVNHKRKLLDMVTCNLMSCVFVEFCS